MRSLLSRIGSTPAAQLSFPKLPVPTRRLDVLEDNLKDSEGPTLESNEIIALRFFVTIFAWVDILSCASGLSIFDATTFDYISLLEDDKGGLQKMMGCENWVMVTMANIALLEEWKKTVSSDNLSLQELVQRAFRIEASLQDGIARLLARRPALTRIDLDSNIITEIFACAAITYLHVVVSGPHLKLPEIHHSIARTLETLTTLPSRLLIRISWPFCITGCMAAPEEEAIFRALVLTAAQAGANTGTAWKGLQVMEECWRLRSAGETADWTTAMKSLGLRILLV